ncbi:MAG: hypothetical protein ACI8SK_001319 [Shewanella sp.]|jgi:hypothetical protein
MKTYAFISLSIGKILTVCITFSMLVGCSALMPTEQVSPHEVSVSELGYYWFVRNGSLDWSSLANIEVKQNLTATLTINSAGIIERVKLQGDGNAINVSAHQLTELSKQKFSPTINNIDKQPVRLTVSISQN